MPRPRGFLIRASPVLIFIALIVTGRSGLPEGKSTTMVIDFLNKFKRKNSEWYSTSPLREGMGEAGKTLAKSKKLD